LGLDGMVNAYLDLPVDSEHGNGTFAPWLARHVYEHLDNHL